MGAKNCAYSIIKKFTRFRKAHTETNKKNIGNVFISKIH